MEALLNTKPGEPAKKDGPMYKVKAPFLKWAGAKTKLVPEIRKLLTPGSRHIEPFAGSAAVWLNTNYPRNLLADVNPDLIGLYRLLQQLGEGLVDVCESLFTAENNTGQSYYSIRDQFNASNDPEVRAALFLYLNKFGFNGLVRYNAIGKFNVPVGRTANGGLPYFPRNEMVAFGRKLASGVELRASDFRDVLAEAHKGDNVYLDPPYIGTSPTADFVSYSAGGFGQQDQAALAALAFEVARRGAVVVVSNSDTLEVRKLYRDAAQVVPLSVQRNISCETGNRKVAMELLFRL